MPEFQEGPPKDNNKMYGGLDLLIMCQAGNSTWVQSISVLTCHSRFVAGRQSFWGTREPFCSGDLPLSFSQFVLEHQSRPPTAGEYHRSKGPTAFRFYVEVGPYLAPFDISPLLFNIGRLGEKSQFTSLRYASTDCRQGSSRAQHPAEPRSSQPTVALFFLSK